MQSLLDVRRRPVVAFDAKNAEHRKHVAEFIKLGTWANCPVTFYTPDGISVRAYAMQELVDFYLQQEFPVTAVAPKKRASVKSTAGGKLISINPKAK